ncbi:23S rRNA (uracil(1939)-C(5))-methyltransferase RlmD [Caldicellulosiruptoraceae bacterium PP1]
MVLLKVNQEIIINIEGINHQGQGIARYEGLVVFVNQALPNELVKAKVKQVKKEYAVAEIIEVIQENSNREEPICSVYSECGGCHFMHANYEFQLELKRQIVEDAMKRIAKLDVKVNKTIGMKNPYYYRNKVQLPITKKDNKVCIGFYKPMSHDVVDIEKCFIQHDDCNKVIPIIKEMIEEFKIEPYNEHKHSGLLRHVLIRKSFAFDTMMIVFVTTKMPKEVDKIKEYLVTRINNLKSLYININDKKTNVILGENEYLIYGEKTIKDKIGKYTFEISPKSFFQVNSEQVNTLYSKVVEYLGNSKLNTIFDAYCGIGTISLYVSHLADKVIGIENVKEAIDDAKKNAKQNGVNNAEFILGNAEDEIPNLIKKGIKPDAIVVDPPRKGCDKKLIDAIINAEINKVVYVSCNPSTLARDLRILVDGGYKVKSVQPVDMFPQSYHVECVVLMSNVKNK